MSNWACRTSRTTAKPVRIACTANAAAGSAHAWPGPLPGRVYNVTKRALGVVVNKRIKNRWIGKKINVRVEHVKHSKCRQDFLR
jgi:ribosomal protein L21E